MGSRPVPLHHGSCVHHCICLSNPVSEKCNLQPIKTLLAWPYTFECVPINIWCFHFCQVPWCSTKRNWQKNINWDLAKSITDNHSIAKFFFHGKFSESFKNWNSWKFLFSRTPKQFSCLQALDNLMEYRVFWRKSLVSKFSLILCFLLWSSEWIYNTLLGL